ncbi:MAG: aldose 1-epimerase family protein [Streptosporangiaceae bacterium]|nr:aldose 1-epimerase family protein [Streptosporangiaceae bacterium]MBV9857144.1 aldose 1-epimerase family protein [Streptosporangiaceae bacterium]
MTATHVPVTGTQYEISAGDYRATITELGAGLRELLHDSSPLIAAYDPDELPPHGAGQLLAPWPNRVDGGRYSFRGAEYQLDLSEPPRRNAIHGLTRWAPWPLVTRGDDSVLLRSVPHGQQGYPFCVEVDAEYRLDATSGLHVTITARNRGTRPAPWGTGSHPYLKLGAPSVDECELTLPAGKWLPVDDRGIPSGAPEDVAGTEFDFRKPRAIGATRLDHAFTGLDRDDAGRAWVHCASNGTRTGLWADAGYRWLQVFTSDPLEPEFRRRVLAVEPMTCPPNAFVTGTDLVVLEPGDSVTQRWGIRIFQPNER